MGMDVYGKQPSSEIGEYFRNNVWWWRPLADYCLEVAPVALTSKCQHWHTNDGAGLNGQDARALAAILRAEVASGRTASYAMAREARVAAGAMSALPRDGRPG
jgi:hypothetical protein